MEPVDPQPGGTGPRGRCRVAGFEQQLGQALGGLERAGAKPLARLDGPLRRAVLGQQLADIKLESLPKVRDGRANLGELQIASPTSHIEGLSLRLYNPQSRQWNIYWANSKDGSLGTPMVGEFKNGRGEFFDQEIFQGKAIYVRFIFSDITPASFRLEQSFSADGGKTWEQILSVNDCTGCYDVKFDPSNPTIMFASMWQAHRTHFYQRATDNGFTVPEIVARVFLLNLALATLALVVVAAQDVLASVAALAGGIALVAWLLATFARRRR